MSDSSAVTLVLNAAEGLLQAVFAVGEASSPSGFSLRLFRERHAPSQGAEALAPMLQEALEALGAPPRAVRRVAAVRGPGSFTGLRLALASAAGLARATGALQAGLDYLPLLALSALLRAGSAGVDIPPESRVWAVTHARRDLVHAQGFDGGVMAENGCPRPVSDLLVLSPEQALLVAAREHEGSGRSAPLIFGSGLTRNREAFDKAAAALPAASIRFMTEPEYEHPLPEALLRAASHAVFGAKDITPLYARPSDAEENLEHIAVSLRLDPAQARRRLEELTGKADEAGQGGRPDIPGAG